MSELFPKDWKVSKLSDLGTSYSGLKSKSKKDFDENGNALFVTYRNINRNYFVDKQDLAPVHVKSTENQNSVKKGDVLFTGSSETPEEVAFSSVMKDEIDNLYLNSFCFGYRFNDSNNTLADFYAYFFRGEYFRKKVFPLAQGSTRYNLSRNELLKVKVPVPSIKEQQKIAAILSSVDEAIEKTEQIIEQIETVKKGLMLQLLTKGIGHKRFKETKVGKIPESWMVQKLGELSDKVTVGYVGSISEAYTDENGVPLLRTGNIKSNGISLNELKYVTEEFHKKQKKSSLLPGDIIISRHGDSGTAAVIPKELEKSNCLNVVVVKKSEKMDSDFIKYMFNSGIIRKQLNKTRAGSVQGVINTKEISNALVTVPPLKEQGKIINILNSIEMNTLLEEKRLVKLKKLKNGLMQLLLTGKVRIPIKDSEGVPS